jgi:hypothetical protein
MCVASLGQNSIPQCLGSSILELFARGLKDTLPVPFFHDAVSWIRCICRLFQTSRAKRTARVVIISQFRSRAKYILRRTRSVWRVYRTQCGFFAKRPERKAKKSGVVDMLSFLFCFNSYGICRIGRSKLLRGLEARVEARAQPCVVVVNYLNMVFFSGCIILGREGESGRYDRQLQLRKGRDIYTLH